jgi:formylglycine-generating enzyme required for sulfatase activity
MPLQGTGIDSPMRSKMESAVASGLSRKYKVLYGEERKQYRCEVFREINEETGVEDVCDDTKCMQKAGIAFQAEIVSTVKVVKTTTGYSLTIKITNIYSNSIENLKAALCEGCNEFQVIDQLKVMAEGTVTTPEGMALVKGCCYKMGDTFGDGFENEKPVHSVCVDDFYMDKYEVTQSSYRAKTGNNPSRRECDDCPVNRITWFEANDYCESIDKRLPTEAEWEYAAREGGKKVKFGNGKNTISKQEANYNYWFFKAVPVGSYIPNALGLYDMSGNVREWVNDWHEERYYMEGVTDNPKGPHSGKSRVIRGGSWYHYPRNVRTSSRNGLHPTTRYYYFGFRCAQ